MSLKKTAHRRGWKAAQSHSKAKHKTKLAILALGLLLLIILAGQTFKFFQGLFQPLSPGNSKTYTWDGSANINLVVKSSEVEVLSYNSVEGTAKLIKIPSSTYINIPGGYGAWPMRAVYDLGQAEKPPQGREFLKRSISAYFGIPIDGFIELKGDQGAMEIMKSITSPVNLNTDLTPIELLRLVFGLKRVRFDKVQTFDLAKMNLLETKELADGQQVLAADSTKIDQFSQNFTETKISQERLTVAVLNATQVPGLAGKAARLISNMGGDVIQQTNFNQNLQASKIVINIADKQVVSSYTYKRLVQVFEKGCHSSQKCDNIQQVETRAQINVIVGEDFY